MDPNLDQVENLLIRLSMGEEVDINDDILPCLAIIQELKNKSRDQLFRKYNSELQKFGVVWPE